SRRRRMLRRPGWWGTRVPCRGRLGVCRRGEWSSVHFLHDSVGEVVAVNVAGPVLVQYGLDLLLGAGRLGEGGHYGMGENIGRHRLLGVQGTDRVGHPVAVLSDQLLDVVGGEGAGLLGAEGRHGRVRFLEGCKRLAQSPVRVEVTALVAARLVPLLLGLLCADAVQLVNDLLALRLHLPVSAEGEASTGPRFVPLLLGLDAAFPFGLPAVEPFAGEGAGGVGEMVGAVSEPCGVDVAVGNLAVAVRDFQECAVVWGCGAAPECHGLLYATFVGVSATFGGHVLFLPVNPAWCGPVWPAGR